MARTGAERSESGQAGALDDLIVLECAQGIAGPWCGKAFADLGADVIKVEPLDGDRARRDGPFPADEPHAERSGRFLYLNTGKRGIALDLESVRARAILRDLVRRADVLIIDLPPSRLAALELDFESLRRVNPRLVMTCLSPFGQEGPYRDYQGNDLIAFHAGGLGRETPYNQVTDLESEPPLVDGAFQAEFLTGWTAATTTLAALSWRDANDEGQLVDVSAMEAVASMLRISLAGVAYAGRIVIPREKNGFAWVQPCQDGHVSLSPFNFDHWWRRFREMAGDPEWAAEELFSNTLGRLQNADLLESLMNEWLSGRTKGEIYALALKYGVPGFPVQSMHEVRHAEQLNARQFFVEIEHPVAGRITQPGPPVRLSETPWRIRGPAPLLGEHTREVLREFGVAEREVEALRRETAP